MSKTTGKSVIVQIKVVAAKIADITLFSMVADGGAIKKFSPQSIKPSRIFLTYFEKYFTCILDSPLELGELALR